MIVGGQTEARGQLSSTIMSRLTRALHETIVDLGRVSPSEYALPP